MSKIETNKKLELVRAIRMQNQYDRQMLRMREGILNPNLPPMQRGELHSLEEPESRQAETGKSSLSHFRLRFVIAALLLISFILCDAEGVSLGGETSESLWERLQDSTNVETLIDQIK